MQPNQLFDFWPAFFFMLVAASAYAFFWFGHNAKLKRRLWPAYAVGGPVLLLLVLWVMDAPNELLYVAVPVFALGGLFSLRAIRFCNACGAAINNFRIPRMRFCPGCGASLVEEKRQ